ncbi:MAG: HAD family acid phosphatase, partial [Pirellulaceae bacterium]|nr:HAD family acid phosphatase [Pirellulaceae bacterium]
TRQTFRLAEMNLGPALVDPTWTASVEQQRMFTQQPRKLAALPPAVILDVDETVLDNSAYQARLIANGGEFDPKTWNLFVQEESAIAVPGAVEFIEACRAARVTVLYVTNREYEVEYATRRNLVKTGLMEEDDPDVLLTKNERKPWTSDKKSRRTHLAGQYRILMILGDDLNDFVSLGKKPTPEHRRKMAARYSDRWGRQWMALPNPNYGGWERSLYDWEDRAERKAKLKLKRSNLRD